MAIPRVGRDISADEYWRERAATYSASIDAEYHADRNRMIDELFEGVALDGAEVVDYGCGEGVTIEQLVGRGASVIGLDPNEELVAAARDRLEDAGTPAEVRLGGMAELEALGSETADVLVALNVLAYMSDAEERAFYVAARRMLRPSGKLIVTHSNELFDLFTLNAYTVDFFARHFVGDEAAGRVAALLVHPDLPQRTTFNIRENPLSYGAKLEEYGFAERRQSFAHSHPVPPLAADAPDPDELDAHTYPDVTSLPAIDQWKRLFQCSMFGVVAERVA